MKKELPSDVNIIIIIIPIVTKTLINWALPSCVSTKKTDGRYKCRKSLGHAAEVVPARGPDDS